MVTTLVELASALRPFSANHSAANQPQLSSQHLQLIKLRQLCAALFSYSSRFIAVLGVCCYLTGFALGFSDNALILLEAE
jgi:hypothetical protein